MAIRRNRRSRVKATEQIDVLEMLLGGPFGLDAATNDAIEKELEKCPAILARWKKERAVTELADDALIAASEQLENPEVRHWAEVEIRVRTRNLETEKEST